MGDYPVEVLKGSLRELDEQLVRLNDRLKGAQVTAEETTGKIRQAERDLVAGRAALALLEHMASQSCDRTLADCAHTFTNPVNFSPPKPQAPTPRRPGKGRAEGYGYALEVPLEQPRHRFPNILVTSSGTVTRIIEGEVAIDEHGRLTVFHRDPSGNLLARMWAPGVWSLRIDHPGATS